MGIVAVTLIGSYVFAVLTNVAPIYICAGILFLSYVGYFWAATKKVADAERDLLNTAKAAKEEDG
jgi:hypothetical protein